MGKFAELCKGKTMGAFFLLLLSPGKTLSYMEEDQTTVAVTIGYECTLFSRKCLTRWYSAHYIVTLPLRCLAARQPGLLSIGAFFRLAPRKAWEGKTRCNDYL